MTDVHLRVFRGEADGPTRFDEFDVPVEGGDGRLHCRTGWGGRAGRGQRRWSTHGQAWHTKVSGNDWHPLAGNRTRP